MPSTPYWLITNRNVTNLGFGPDRAEVSFWSSTKDDITVFANWSRVPDRADFEARVLAAAARFPLLPDNRQEAQKHVTLAVHGFNNNWQDAVSWYKQLCDELFRGRNSLGLCILFSWPSDGMPSNYLPDRMDAEKSAPDLADVLSRLYDLLAERQAEAAADPAKACRAKTSIIAHSMGNYVLQRAMQFAWTRKNQPLLVSLVNQLVMVAADVDNDLFSSGETVTKGDGDAIANLTYRVTALYTGRDSALGLSAGLKHFGKRRLGRSGLDQRTRIVPDNVWDVDCSRLFSGAQDNIHSAYFSESKTLGLIADVLRGLDRNVITQRLARPRS